jgi:tetratricopeptide (TPR) repeat protein
MRRLVALAIVATFAACARPPKPLPTPGASFPEFPQFPEFVVPAVPPGLSDSPAAGNQVRGWGFLQAGDFKSAERELGAALKADPAFYPAEAAFGWVELARKDAKSALPHFDRALEREHRDVSALVGRGQALFALNRESEALTAFEAAVAEDPSLTDLGRRVEVLRFRHQQEDLTRAREAARTGRSDEAVSLYNRAIASSPDSAFLYRELANVEHQQGADDRALEHFRKAIALDPPDARSLAQVGAISKAPPRPTPSRLQRSRAMTSGSGWRTRGPALKRRVSRRSTGTSTVLRRRREPTWRRSVVCASRRCCRRCGVATPC